MCGRRLHIAHSSYISFSQEIWKCGSSSYKLKSTYLKQINDNANIWERIEKFCRKFDSNLKFLVCSTYKCDTPLQTLRFVRRSTCIFYKYFPRIDQAFFYKMNTIFVEKNSSIYFFDLVSFSKNDKSFLLFFKWTKKEQIKKQNLFFPQKY